jgi:RNA-directed DNA polymerase
MRIAGLELSPEKTSITPIETGFDFLGQNVRKYRNGKVIITPSANNVKAFLAKVRQRIKGNAQAKAGKLIAQLNPLLRGWANYHRHVCSKRTFGKIDAAIFRALWRWACRRHPNKPRHWVKSKYYQSTDQRHWVFCGTALGREGKPYRVRLFCAADVAIKRHVKIKGEANPYDPA